MERKIISRYIVADPRICHGKPTFRGTRIIVSQVLEQVASGMAWEVIVEEWRGSVLKRPLLKLYTRQHRHFSNMQMSMPLRPLPRDHPGRELSRGAAPGFAGLAYTYTSDWL